MRSFTRRCSADASLLAVRWALRTVPGAIVGGVADALRYTALYRPRLERVGGTVVPDTVATFRDVAHVGYSATFRRHLHVGRTDTTGPRAQLGRVAYASGGAAFGRGGLKLAGGRTAITVGGVAVVALFAGVECVVAAGRPLGVGDCQSWILARARGVRGKGQRGPVGSYIEIRWATCRPSRIESAD